jgi:hypothetical protein
MIIIRKIQNNNSLAVPVGLGRGIRASSLVQTISLSLYDKTKE